MEAGLTELGNDGDLALFSLFSLPFFELCRQIAGVPDWFRDSVFYLIYCLGTPGNGGGGFFGDCPDVNDQVSEPVPRLLRLRLW